MSLIRCLCRIDQSQAAVKSAMTAMEHLRQYNETARNDDFKIVIGGLGVATGSRIIQVFYVCSVVVVVIIVVIIGVIMFLSW